MRQKTPHPKELKAKAHKLFGASGKAKPQNDEEPAAPQNGDHHHHHPAEESQQQQPVQQQQQQQQPQQQVSVEEEQQYKTENGDHHNEDEDYEEVSLRDKLNNIVHLHAKSRNNTVHCLLCLGYFFHIL